MEENLNYHSSGKTVFDDSMKDIRFAEYGMKWRGKTKKRIVEPFPLHLDI